MGVKKDLVEDALEDVDTPDGPRTWLEVVRPTSSSSQRERGLCHFAYVVPVTLLYMLHVLLSKLIRRGKRGVVGGSKVGCGCACNSWKN
jgi:hypothetical protein